MSDNRPYIWGGMFDKTLTPNQKDKLDKGVVPEDVMKLYLEDDGIFSTSVLSRHVFPFKKSTGEEQVYFGWYVLIPKDRDIVSFVENNISQLNPDDFEIRHVTFKKVEYVVYGKFGVAKTSDNWLMKIILESE